MDYQNTRALALLGNYLNERPAFIRPDEVRALTDLGVPAEQAVAQLVAAACGLNVADNPADKTLFKTYLEPGFKELAAPQYQQDAYYRQINIAAHAQGNFALTRLSYRPYECFVRDDLQRGPRGEALAQIGFFAEEFTYPAVLENERIWMSVTPNEIETMRGPLVRARGRVLTYGLGLGYFAFHASEKAGVARVTVVERSPQALQLFTKYILPQFSHPEKIQLVEADAFDFMERTDISGQFDYVFADLWRDVSDGLALYKRLKMREKLYGGKPVFDYWIEPTLRFYL